MILPNIGTTLSPPPPPPPLLSYIRPKPLHLASTSESLPNEDASQPPKKQRLPPYPKIGDIVRYYQLDGGRADGQELVGKISLIQPILSSSPSTTPSSWLVEIAELDPLGDGFYAEYPYRQQRSKRTTKPLTEISPLLASYVRTEDAYRVPRNGDGTVRPSFESYRIEGYEGPVSVGITVDREVLESDGKRYGELKGGLLRDAALAGAVGTLLANLVRGGESAVIYAAGALAGVGYLYFLSIKTDTVGSTDSKFGNNISNFRFLLPAVVLIGVSIRNAITDPASLDAFSTVTKDQFAAAIVGFLTYRIPLFLRQLAPAVSDTAGSFLPGSAGIVAQLARKNDEQASSSPLVDNIFDELKPVLLVSGPSSTGKTSLVKALVESSNGRFVEPTRIDRMTDGARFEILEKRGEIISYDPTGRYGLSRSAILNATDVSGDERRVAVIDADVGLAKTLTQTLGGARLIGVWVGLDAIEKFEERIKGNMEKGIIKVPQDETKESVLRAKIKEVVKDIEYGVVSGVFEFTILNDDFDESLKELKEAAEYCFK